MQPPATRAASGPGRSGQQERQLAGRREVETAARQPRVAPLQREAPNPRSPARYGDDRLTDAAVAARAQLTAVRGAAGSAEGRIGSSVERGALLRWRAEAKWLRRTARLEQRGRDIDRIKWGERLLLSLAAEVGACRDEPPRGETHATSHSDAVHALARLSCGLGVLPTYSKPIACASVLPFTTPSHILRLPATAVDASRRPAVRAGA